LIDTSSCENVTSDHILEWFLVDYTMPEHMVLSDIENMGQEQG
jgi:hypothetical protein